MNRLADELAGGAVESIKDSYDPTSDRYLVDQMTLDDLEAAHLIYRQVLDARVDWTKVVPDRPTHIVPSLTDPESFVSTPPAGIDRGSVSHMWEEIAELRRRLAKKVVELDNALILLSRRKEQ